jgi:hypothetical protein
MKQTQKLDALISRIIKEELEEETYAGPEAIAAMKNNSKYKIIKT